MRSILVVGLAAVVISSVAGPAEAVHFYRTTEDGPNGCKPASGEVSDDPVDENGDPVHGPIAAEIRLYHNTFHDAETMATETTIKAGEAIRWTWNSAHCHSVQADDGSFTSGYLYPTEPPESPQVVPGFFEYPILDETPTLSYVRTFPTPGTYDYFCIHHELIGMFGKVIVE